MRFCCRKLHVEFLVLLQLSLFTAVHQPEVLQLGQQQRVKRRRCVSARCACRSGRACIRAVTLCL